MLSSDAVALFADESFDFIYIDARHDYTAGMEDLHAWYGCTRHVVAHMRMAKTTCDSRQPTTMAVCHCDVVREHGYCIGCYALTDV